MEYILITGASSGIGRELAVYLSRQYRIILNGRNIDNLTETQSMCKNDTLIWQYDLTNVETLEKDFSSWINQKEVAISSFIHCAGVINMTPLRNVNVKMMQNVFYTHVFSPELITKILVSRNVNAKNLNSVVFISSNISNRGASAFSIYGSSKAALDGLMRNLAIELAPSVRVNSVLPGGVITEMTNELFEDEGLKKQFELNYPLGLGMPSDISPIVEFLISDKSRWLTGQQIVVDGGRTIDITERNKETNFVR